MLKQGCQIFKKNCQKLIDIINQQFSWAKNPPQLASYRDKSTELVLEAITHDVE